MKKFIALLMALVMAMSLATVAWGAEPVEVSDEAGVVAAFENGGTYKLTKSVAVAENTRFVVGSGKTVTLDLGGFTLSSTNTETNTHNFFIDVNGGTLTISNGAVEYTHTGNNMGWNGACTVIDVTADGVLNMNGVTVKNLGGTDMNFCVHMNNWGSVTFDANNCVFDAPYCGVRVFNSGPAMNDVTIKNSALKGATRAFWVHNYASSDMGGKVYSGASVAYDESEVLARLDLDIYNNGNTFELTGTAKSPIRYGFNEPVYFTEQGVRVTDVAVAEPETNTDNLDTDEKELVKDVATSFDSAANEALGNAASAVADNNPVSADDVASALAGASITGAVEEFNIVVESSFDVEITEVVADNTDVTSITLNITPVYQMVATNGTDEVVLDKGELEITEPVTVTVKIPDTLAEQANGKLYVTHKNTYVYEATVAGTAGNYTATFTSEHGFSPFVFSLSPTTVAVVNNVEYANLQAAVDAAPVGATITLVKDYAENVTVGKVLVIDPDGHKCSGKISATAKYSVIKTGGKYVIVTKQSAGSGSVTTLKDADGYDIYGITGTKSVKKADANITETVTGNSIASDGTVTYTATTYSDGANTYVEVDATIATHKLMDGDTVATYLVNLADIGYIPTTTKEVSSYVESVEDAECGEYDEAKYPNGVYIIDDQAYVVGGSNWAVLNGKFVSYGAKATAVQHTYVKGTHNSDGSLATVKCSVCGDIFDVLTKNDVAAMVPADYTKISISGVSYYITTTATNAAASTSGTTIKPIQSAPTFDAGIAMYVGMSVMAAAGSAVVIGKKKD